MEGSVGPGLTVEAGPPPRRGGGGGPPWNAAPRGLGAGLAGSPPLAQVAKWRGGAG